MKHLPSEVSNGTVITAILESDAVVHAVQHELKTLYPDRVISPTSIRRILRDKVLCQELLNDERLGLAKTQLAKAKAQPFDSHRKRPVSFVPASLADGEEALWDILWYDMTYASCGG